MAFPLTRADLEEIIGAKNLDQALAFAGDDPAEQLKVLNGALERGETKIREFLTEANLTGAELTEADLRAVLGLTCDQLQEAAHWESAYRDPELACGADIPQK